MQKIPSVSVVIPTYNRVFLLKETIESVRAQTFDDFEIIVVDDGSIDETWEWLRRQSDIRAFRQTNQGIAASRNLGVSKARANWVALLDHDDVWLKEKLRLQMGFIEEKPDVALVAARHVRMGKSIRNPRRIRWIHGDLFAAVYAKSFIHTSSVIIRRDVLESIGGFDPKYRFADEFDVWLKVARDYNIAYLNKPLVLIRFYEANTSHDRLGLREDTQDILLKHYDPCRISESVFKKTLSDHDISYGRAYLKAGDSRAALECFWRSVERTPFRLRSWRYFLRHNMAKWLAGNCGRRVLKRPPQRGTILHAFRLKRSKILMHSEASAILGGAQEDVESVIRGILKKHREILGQNRLLVCKDSPETTVTLVQSDQCPVVCLKEYHWRGLTHAAKSLFRPSHGIRTFSNGLKLNEKGIDVAKPLALIQDKFLGIPQRECVVMEVISTAQELDRYLLRQRDQGCSLAKKRDIVRNFGRFIGVLHRKGIYHSDLKTCNILVSEPVNDGELSRGSDGKIGQHRDSANTLRIVPIDYDDVSFSHVISERKRIKNLVQLFLSTPLFITFSDRVRFINAYGCVLGLSRADRRRISRKVIHKAWGKAILYVSTTGDVTENWTPIRQRKSLRSSNADLIDREK